MVWAVQGRYGLGPEAGSFDGQMYRLVTLWAILCWLGLSAVAQETASPSFSGLARLDVGQSALRDAGTGMEVTLYLSQPVPFRVFTLADPMRLVMDFREVDWRGATPEALLETRAAIDLRFGSFRPGWSRLVVDLARPMNVTLAGMDVGEQDGTATLRVVLADVEEDVFRAAAGAPPDPGWDSLGELDTTLAAPLPDPDGPLIVVIDPGHGGIDPGAERAGLVEAELMLTFGLELAEAINRTGDMRAILTRSSDVFVPLAERMSIARAAAADVLISLHADALEEDAASGASVYTLSAEALDQASERMAERHNRGDLLAGLDLSGQDDTVATILMDLARLETGPASIRLADRLVATLTEGGAVMNRHPRREGPLAVLNAADFPSVLIEAGFLSSQEDRERLSTAEGRALIVKGIVTGLQAWASEEAALDPLLRQ
jgi:N-acetylmuramoyl-L-alanine amidase